MLKFFILLLPGYQSKEIDSHEEKYRQNERCVYQVRFLIPATNASKKKDQASADEVMSLFSRIQAHLPTELNMGRYGLGVWRAVGLNDMWRFYKYNCMESEKDVVLFDNALSDAEVFLVAWFSPIVFFPPTESCQGCVPLFSSSSRQSDNKKTEFDVLFLGSGLSHRFVFPAGVGLCRF